MTEETMLIINCRRRIFWASSRTRSLDHQDVFHHENVDLFHLSMVPRRSSYAPVSIINLMMRATGTLREGLRGFRAPPFDFCCVHLR